MKRAYEVQGYVNPRSGTSPTYRPSRRNHNLSLVPGVDIVYFPRTVCTVCRRETDWLQNCPQLKTSKVVALRIEMMFYKSVIEILRSCSDLELILLVYKVFLDASAGLGPSVEAYCLVSQKPYFKCQLCT
jgi:hypothetical protein